MSPQDIWQSQSKDAPRVTLGYLQHRMRNLEGGNRAKLKRLVIIQSLLTLHLGWWIFTKYVGKPILQIAVGFALVSMWVWIYFWKRKMAPAPFDTKSGVLDTLHYYRGELERQRDAHRHNWRVALLMNLVGLPLLGAGYVLENHLSWMVLGFMAIFAAALMVLGLWNFARIARRLQSEIDAVDLLTQG